MAVVESASLPEQRVRYTTLAALPHLAAAEIAGPALILLGPQFVARESVADERGSLAMSKRVAQGDGLKVVHEAGASALPQAAVAAFLCLYI